LARTFGGDQNEESTKRVVGTKEKITPAEHIISADLIKSISSMQSAIPLHQLGSLLITSNDILQLE
jgi:hypothetical protein